MLFRLALAMLAILVVTLGATIRLVIGEIDATVPGTMIEFATLGVATSITLFVLASYFLWLTGRSLLRLKRSMEVSHV